MRPLGVAALVSHRAAVMAAVGVWAFISSAESVMSVWWLPQDIEINPEFKFALI